MVSTFAKKLLLWFRRYKVSATDYSERVGAITKGAEFKTVLEELVDAEDAGTAPTSVVLSQSTLQIFVGESYVISSYVLPEVAAQDYTVTVATPARAAVYTDGIDKDGNQKWVVVGKSAGTTNISFAAKSDVTKKATLALTVVNMGS